MTSILAFVVVLGVLIFVHELGHFAVAKLSGIAVPRFSIGLGPKVWGVKIGETEYVLSAFPLGGYVKMAGMAEDEALEALEGGKSDLQVPPERRFDQKSIPVRAAVISAGVAMNFLFAILVFAGMSYHTSIAPLIAGVQEGSPADEAGVRGGDLVLAVDSQRIELWLEFVEYVSRRPGEEIALRIERGDEQLDLTTRVMAFDTVLTTFEGNDTTLTLGRIGVYRDTVSERRAYGLGTALWVGTRQTVQISGLVLDFLGQLITGRASPRDLGGPIMIGQYSGRAARLGVAAFVSFMAFLSVNLAILNLLPIPILDGGHLVFLGLEAVRGQALSLQARARLSQFGFILLMALMVWVFTSDVLRLTGN